MSTWLDNLRGSFIVFDGPDGSGKSTQLHRFAARCRDAGLEVCEVREPGGTRIGEQVRDVLLDPAHVEMGVRCETLLYMASRAQLVDERIRPAQARGEVVLADRFISSTLAYQGAAGGMSRDEILAVGRVAVGDCWPDLVVIFDVDEKTAAVRLSGKRSKTMEPTLFSDRMERKQADYRKRVREGFLDQARHAPEGEYLVVKGSSDPDKVFAEMMARMETRFE